ncbi:MAG: Crp/Fnr family transcriptional regulator [Alphaproteobacteria bacterium]|nr:Crp/Fnr family transcriptional regulator [Alphaproteobacteria bacterium]
MILSSDILKTLNLFSDTSEDENLLVIQNSHVRHFKPEEIVYNREDLAKNFYIILEGIIEISRENISGQKIMSEILIKGDVLAFDEITSIDPTYQYTARTITNSSLIEIDAIWIQNHLSDFNNLTPKLFGSILKKLQQIRLEIEQSSSMETSQIVACHLKKLCIDHKLNPFGFMLPYSKTLMASRLHITLEAFSRSLRKLKSYGIQVTGRHVSFININKSRRFVCDQCPISKNCTAYKHLHSFH